MKKFKMLLAAALCLALLAGCAGTPVVYYTDCTCPSGSHTPTVELTEGSVKTGLAVIALPGAKTDGASMEFDITVAAVTVDDSGIIRSCSFDSAGPKILVDATGKVLVAESGELKTKNELGDAYNMKLYGKAKAEWYEQAAALAKFAVGKTVEQLRQGAVSESGHAVDADLASHASIKLGGYVDAIEKAVNNATHLGANSADSLKLAVILSAASSADATAEKDGTVQLDCEVIALTEKDGIITSCAIDSLQAKVGINAAGVLTAPESFATKNELGEAYNMKLYGKAKFEWNEQAANFAAYVKGKTAAQVAGIAVTEGKPSGADLASSVTIKITPFQDLIAKALG